MIASRYLTVEEFAAWFSIPAKTVRQRIRQHAGNPDDPATLAAINVGTERAPQYRIPRSEVERYGARSAA